MKICLNKIANICFSSLSFYFFFRIFVFQFSFVSLSNIYIWRKKNKRNFYLLSIFVLIYEVFFCWKCNFFICNILYKKKKGYSAVKNASFYYDSGNIIASRRTATIFSWNIKCGIWIYFHSGRTLSKQKKRTVVFISNLSQTLSIL